MSLSSMVDELFWERWPEGYKNATVEIAEYVSRTTGLTVDRQVIYRIRTGKVSKVDARIAAAIADFFGKPGDYFSRRTANKAGRPAADDVLAQAERETDLELVGLRSASELTDDARAELARLLRQAREVIDGGTSPTEQAG
jgi:hypothetical protein